MKIKATWKDVARLTSVDAGHSSSAGNRVDLTTITIFTRDGRKFELPMADQHSYGSNRIEDGHEEPVTVEEFCKEMKIQPGNVAKVKKHREYSCPWENADFEKDVVFLMKRRKQ